MQSFRRLVPKLTKGQRQVAVDLLNRVYEIANQVKPRHVERGAGTRLHLPAGGHLLESRYQVFLIEGTRGAGKSTVLRSLQCTIPLLGRHRGRGTDDEVLFREDGETPDGLLALVKDGELPARLLQAHEKDERDGAWTTALCLPAIDPSRREVNEAPMMEQILAYIDNFLSERMPPPEALTPAAEAEEWRFVPKAGPGRAGDPRVAADLRRTLREQVFRGWILAQPSGQQVISQDVAGSDDFVVARAEEAGRAARRHQTWHDFVDRLLNAYRARLLVLFFDDCDLIPETIEALLETIRLYLDHPRIVVLVAGNRPAIHANLKTAGLSRLAGIAPIFSLINQRAREEPPATGALNPLPGAGAPRHLVDTYLDLVTSRIEEANRYVNKFLPPGQQFTLHPPDPDVALEYVFEPLVASIRSVDARGETATDRAGIPAALRHRLRTASEERDRTGSAAGASRQTVDAVCDALLWLHWRGSLSRGLTLRVLSQVREYLGDPSQVAAKSGAKRWLAPRLPALLDEEGHPDESAEQALNAAGPLEVRLVCGRDVLRSVSPDDVMIDIATESVELDTDGGWTRTQEPSARRLRAYRQVLVDEARLKSLTRPLTIEVVTSDAVASAPPSDPARARGADPHPGRDPIGALDDTRLVSGAVSHPVRSLLELGAALATCNVGEGGEPVRVAAGLDEILFRSYMDFDPASLPAPPSNAFLTSQLLDLAVRVARAPASPTFEARDLRLLIVPNAQAAGKDDQDHGDAPLPTLLMSAAGPGRTSPAIMSERLRRYGLAWQLVRGRLGDAEAGADDLSNLTADTATFAFAQDLETSISRALAFRQQLAHTADQAAYTAAATLILEPERGHPRRKIVPSGTATGFPWHEFQVPALGTHGDVRAATRAVTARLEAVAGAHVDLTPLAMHRALHLHLIVATLFPLIHLRRLGVAEATDCLRVAGALRGSRREWEDDLVIATGDALFDFERRGVWTAPSPPNGHGGAKALREDALSRIRDVLDLLQSAPAMASFGDRFGFDQGEIDHLSRVLVLDREIVALALGRVLAIRAPRLSPEVQRPRTRSEARPGSHPRRGRPA